MSIKPTESLTKIPELTGIDLAVAQPIIDAFMPHYMAAMELAEKAKAINVTDPTDCTGIKAARVARLELRKPRLEAEEVHKREKNVYLRMGKAIDGIRNRIKGICEPEETRLQAMEDIAERMESERLAKLGAERFNELSQFTLNIPPAGELGRWPKPQYDNYLAGAKAEKARVEKEEADRKAREEAEQMEREMAEAEAASERERLAKIADDDRKARQKAEAAAAEAKRKAAAELAKQRAEAEKAAAAQRAEAARIEAEHQAQLRAERAAAEAAARKEREAREKAEAEARKLREAEEAKRKAEADAARKAAAAPDKEKLMQLASDIRTFAQTRNISMSTNEAAQAVGMVIASLGRLAKSVEDAAEDM